MSRFAEIDERLNDLQSRRKLLEEKDLLRNSSMKKVSIAHEKNRNELIIDMENRAEMARNRNQGLLREIGSSLKSAKEFTVSSHRLKTPGSHTLKVAKETLGKNIDVMLPNWRDYLASKRADTIRRLEKEKAKVILRRENMKGSMEREENERRIVEGKRRELLEQLTLEQQEILSAESRGILMREEAEMVDDAMMRQVEDAGQMLQNLIDEQKSKTAEIVGGNTNDNVNTHYKMNVNSVDTITGTGTTGRHSTSLVKIDSESTSIPTSATTTTTTASTLTGTGRLDTAFGSETKEGMLSEKQESQNQVNAPTSPGPPLSRRISSPGRAGEFDFELSAAPISAAINTAATNDLKKKENSQSPSTSYSPVSRIKPPSPRANPAETYGNLELSRSKASAAMAAAASSNDTDTMSKESKAVSIPSNTNSVNVVSNSSSTKSATNTVKEQTTSPSSSTTLRTVTVQHASSRRVDFTGIDIIDIETCASYLKPLFKYLTGLEGGVNLDHIYDSAEDEATPDLSVLSNLRNADSVEVESLLSHTAAASLVLYIMKEIGTKLLPLNLLEGMTNLKKIDTEHLKMGKKYTEAWSLVCDHLRTLTRGNKELRPVPIDHLVPKFCEALTNSFDEEDSNRVRRKVTNILLHALQSPATTTTTSDSSSSSSSNAKGGVTPFGTTLNNNIIDERIKISSTVATIGPSASSASTASSLPTASRGIGGTEESVVLFPNQQDNGNDQPSMINRPLNDTSKRNLSMTAGTINISELDDDDDFEDDEIPALPEMTDLAPSDDDSM